MFTHFLKRKRNDLIISSKDLEGYKAAILATDGFEASELFGPKAALEKNGCKTFIISLHRGRIRSINHYGFGKGIWVTETIKNANPDDYDYLVIPGGQINSDKLRSDENAITFVESFIKRRRPIAAISHGVQILIETDYVENKSLTSSPSIKTDLMNAGAIWIDKEVISEGRLITSRRPSDLKFFIDAMLKEFNYYRAHEAIPNTEGYVVTL